MKLLLTVISAILVVSCSGAVAQSYRSTVNDGNDDYHAKQYDRAREKYKKAAVGEPERPESFFNSGNAAYRTDDVKAALAQYEKAGVRVKDKETLARTIYNAGNTFLNAAEKGVENPVLKQAAGEQAGNLQMEGYKQAIEMYKKALKLDPDDQDARYNLTYARKKLEDLKKQDQNKDQKQDQKKDKQQKQKDDKQQDQQNKDKNKQEEQKKKDKQDQEKQQNQNQKNDEEKEKAKKDQQQQPKPDKDQNMSKQQAEQILRALQRDEKELQKKKRQQQGSRVKVEKDW